MTHIGHAAESDIADLTQIWRLRAFEEQVLELWQDGDIVGSVHLDVGQEAIPVGIGGLVGPDDAIFATYRGHGYALASGASPESLFAELMGRTTGVNGGRGGSAYLTAPDVGFYGENSIVGAGAPIAAGAALAGRYDGTDRIAITIFGDGAMNQGSVHEAMNFATAMNLPVVFVCVNNGWSELTAIADMVRVPELYRRAAAYGMPGERIDGNDPSAVRERVGDAVENAREGGGPALIEAMTARLVGHYIGDAGTYRLPGELAQAQAAEPVALLSRRLAGRVDVAVLEQQARAEMRAAADLARQAPLAEPSTAGDHVYA